MLRRRHWVVLGCGLLASGAVVLRVWAHAQQEVLVLDQASHGDGGASEMGRIPGDSAVPLAPRDYVLHPDVAPGEDERGPARIVSLAPSITETLCALGLADRLVGRTQFCKYPPEITRPGAVPIVGSIMDTNLEMIRALQPDLVLTTTNSGDAGPKVDALGLRHVALPHDSLEDVFACIERVGEVCDRPESARRLVTAIRQDIERLSQTARTSGAKPLRVLMVCGDMPVPPTAVWVAGPGLFLDALLTASGQRNAATELLNAPFGEIPLERLVVLDPDVILTFPDRLPTIADTRAMYRSWSPLSAMRAIRNQRIRVVGGSEWLSAGPRVAVELHRMISVLHALQP